METTGGSKSNWQARALRAAMACCAGLRDVVLPPACLGCGSLVHRHGSVCAACWQRLHFIERPFCPILGTPFAHDMGDAIISAAAIADPPRFDRARAAVLYDDLAATLVQNLKYRDRTDLAPTMARWMVRAAETHLAVAHAIVPVPLHRKRLLSRRFNQSAELARAIARIAGKPMLPGALIRQRATRQQVGLGDRQRRENVRGAFVVPQARTGDIAGQRIVLVDDVFTTGATVDAATRALRKAGASEVTVLTFARVHKGLI